MSDGVNFFRIQEILNQIASLEEEEGLTQEEIGLIESWGYKVSGDPAVKQDHDTVIILTMNHIGAENAKERKVVLNALNEVINELKNTVDNDIETTNIINSVLHKFAYAPDSVCTKDLESLIKLFQEKIAEVKTKGMSPDSTEAQLEALLAKFIKYDPITDNDYDSLVALLGKLTPPIVPSSKDETINGSTIKTVTFTYNNKTYSFQSNRGQTYDEQIQKFIDDELDGKEFESENAFIAFCGDFYVDLKCDIENEDNDYIYYSVSNSQAAGASAYVTIRKAAAGAPSTGTGTPDVQAFLNGLTAKEDWTLEELKQACNESDYAGIIKISDTPIRSEGEYDIYKVSEDGVEGGVEVKVKKAAAPKEKTAQDYAKEFGNTFDVSVLLAAKQAGFEVSIEKTSGDYYAYIKTPNSDELFGCATWSTATEKDIQKLVDAGIRIDYYEDEVKGYTDYFDYDKDNNTYSLNFDKLKTAFGADIAANIKTIEQLKAAVAVKEAADAAKRQEQAITDWLSGRTEVSDDALTNLENILGTKPPVEHRLEKHDDGEDIPQIIITINGTERTFVDKTKDAKIPRDNEQKKIDKFESVIKDFASGKIKYSELIGELCKLLGVEKENIGEYVKLNGGAGVKGSGDTYKVDITFNGKNYHVECGYDEVRGGDDDKNVLTFSKSVIDEVKAEGISIDKFFTVVAYSGDDKSSGALVYTMQQGVILKGINEESTAEDIINAINGGSVVNLDENNLEILPDSYSDEITEQLEIFAQGKMKYSTLIDKLCELFGVDKADIGKYVKLNGGAGVKGPGDTYKVDITFNGKKYHVECGYDEVRGGNDDKNQETISAADRNEVVNQYPEMAKYYKVVLSANNTALRYIKLNTVDGVTYEIALQAAKTAKEKFNDIVTECGANKIPGYSDNGIIDDYGRDKTYRDFRSAFEARIQIIDPYFENKYGEKYTSIKKSCEDEVVKTYKKDGATVKDAVDMYLRLVFDKLNGAQEKVDLSDDEETFVKGIVDESEFGIQKLYKNGKFDDIGDVTDEIEDAISGLKDILEAKFKALDDSFDFETLFNTNLQKTLDKYAGISEAIDAKTVIDFFLKKIYATYAEKAKELELTYLSTKLKDGFTKDVEDVKKFNFESVTSSTTWTGTTTETKSKLTLPDKVDEHNVPEFSGDSKAKTLYNAIFAKLKSLLKGDELTLIGGESGLHKLINTVWSQALAEMNGDSINISAFVDKFKEKLLAILNNNDSLKAALGIVTADSRTTVEKLQGAVNYDNITGSKPAGTNAEGVKSVLNTYKNDIVLCLETLLSSANPSVNFNELFDILAQQYSETWASKNHLSFDNKALVDGFITFIMTKLPTAIGGGGESITYQKTSAGSVDVSGSTMDSAIYDIAELMFNDYEDTDTYYKGNELKTKRDAILTALKDYIEDCFQSIHSLEIGSFDTFWKAIDQAVGYEGNWPEADGYTTQDIIDFIAGVADEYLQSLDSEYAIGNVTYENGTKTTTETITLNAPKSTEGQGSQSGDAKWSQPFSEGDLTGISQENIEKYFKDGKLNYTLFNEDFFGGAKTLEEMQALSIDDIKKVFKDNALNLDSITATVNGKKVSYKNNDEVKYTDPQTNNKTKTREAANTAFKTLLNVIKTRITNYIISQMGYSLKPAEIDKIIDDILNNDKSEVYGKITCGSNTYSFKVAEAVDAFIEDLETWLNGSSTVNGETIYNNPTKQTYTGAQIIDAGFSGLKDATIQLNDKEVPYFINDGGSYRLNIAVLNDTSKSPFKAYLNAGGRILNLEDLRKAVAYSTEIKDKSAEVKGKSGSRTGKVLNEILNDSTAPFNYNYKINSDGSIEFGTYYFYVSYSGWVDAATWSWGSYNYESIYGHPVPDNTSVFNDLKDALESTYSDELTNVFGNDTQAKINLFNFAMFRVLSKTTITPETRQNDIMKQVITEYKNLLEKAAKDTTGKARDYIANYHTNMLNGKSPANMGGTQQDVNNGTVYYVWNSTEGGDNNIDLENTFGEDTKYTIGKYKFANGIKVKTVNCSHPNDTKPLNDAIQKLLGKYVNDLLSQLTAAGKSEQEIEQAMIKLVNDFNKAIETAINKMDAAENNDLIKRENVYRFNDNNTDGKYRTKNDGFSTVQGCLLQIMYEMEAIKAKSIFG